MKHDLKQLLTFDELEALAAMTYCQTEADDEHLERRTKSGRSRADRRRATKKHHRNRLAIVQIATDRMDVALNHNHYNGHHPTNIMLDDLCRRAVHLGHRLHSDLRQEVAMPAKQVRATARRAGRKFARPTSSN